MDKIVSSQLFPPGYDGEREYKRICVMYWFAVVWRFQFFYRYYDAYKYGFWNKQEFALFLGVSRPTLDRYLDKIKAKIAAHKKK